MTIFSQRDWKWRWKRLGFKFATIGQVGCTLTCLSMVTDTFPDAVNELFKSRNGFVYGNIVNWSTINNSLPLQFVTRVEGYDNQQVLDAISKYRFCLVEVDATPIGNPGGRHWVVFLGSHILIDPWDGKKKSTTTYSPTGFCVLSK